MLVASLLLFLARVGAIAVSLPSTNQASSLTADGSVPTTVSEGKGLKIKRQDLNRQAIRHPSLLSNSFRG